MRNRLSQLLSAPMLVAMLALSISLAGVSYAAVNLPNHSVGTAQLKKDAVRSKQVDDGSLLAKDFKDGQLPAGPRGTTGPPGAKGADSFSLISGQASAAGFDLSYSLDGERVSPGSYQRETVSSLSPSVPTTVRNLSVRITVPSGPAQRYHRVGISANGVLVLSCAVPPDELTCTSGSDVGTIPANSLIAMEHYSQGNSSFAPSETRMYWGLSIGS